MKKIIISVVSCLLLFTSDMAIAGDVERPCEVKDLVGAWELITAKYAGEVPDAYHDLLQPYQVRVYKKDHSFQQVASNKKLSNDQLTNLLSISQEETYKVENGLISTLDNQGKILERYSCSYFVEDAPKIKITKGTLSLLWTRQGKPLILNTYKKVTSND